MRGARKSEGGILTTLSLQSGGQVPLFRQIYAQLRDAILSGQLSSGKRLPSSRTLARELGAARNTVLNAFDQLKAEGYLEGHVGRGTTVARDLPDDARHCRRARPTTPGSAAPAPAPPLIPSSPIP